MKKLQHGSLGVGINFLRMKNCATCFFSEKTMNESELVDFVALVEVENLDVDFFYYQLFVLSNKANINNLQLSRLSFRLRCMTYMTCMHHHLVITRPNVQGICHMGQYVLLLSDLFHRLIFNEMFTIGRHPPPLRFPTFHEK